MSDREALESLIDDGVIDEVLGPLAGGKEASVHLCRTPDDDLVAVKVYRARDHRDFRHSARYREGQVIGKARDRRAVRKMTSWGKTVAESWWQGHEYEVLSTLHGAGADVPRPVAGRAGSVVMEFVGDENGAAPQLRRVHLDRAEAMLALDRLIQNVELFLRHDIVHADLSAYNVLWWEGAPVIIDVPQAVDARTHPAAAELLRRDLANIGTHFARFGVPVDADALAHDLWVRYEFAML